MYDILISRKTEEERKSHLLQGSSETFVCHEKIARACSTDDHVAKLFLPEKFHHCHRILHVKDLFWPPRVQGSLRKRG